MATDPDDVRKMPCDRQEYMRRMWDADGPDDSTDISKAIGHTDPRGPLAMFIVSILFIVGVVLIGVVCLIKLLEAV